MPAVKLSPLFNDQTVTSTGDPASGYKVYTYAAGSSTLLASYTDSTGSVAQTNPVLLNSSGYPTNGPIWLQTGLSYKLVLTDAIGNVIRTIDSVTGINDSSSSTNQWLSSNVTPTYISTTSFSLPGDQTVEFHVGRRIQATVTAGTVYGEIVSSSYTTLTTVVVRLDSGNLDSGLSTVNLGIVRVDHPAFEYLQNHGQCRLAKSGSNLVLSPYNGNKLVIGGVIYTIPSAGVSLAPTSLSVGVTHYIYAYMNSGVMTMEASTTGYGTDTTTGVLVKTGDATRTLVGMARVITGPAWQDTSAQRFVRSWFNDPGIAGFANFTADRSTASATYVELNSEIRNEFLSWAGEIVVAIMSGETQNSGVGTNRTSLGFDGTTAAVAESGGQCGGTTSTGGYVTPVSGTVIKTGLAEGYHFATMLGRVNAGTGTWAGTSAGAISTVQTMIKR